MYTMPMYWPFVWYSMWLEAMTRMWMPAAEEMREVAGQAVEQANEAMQSTVTPINPAVAAVGLDMPSPQEIGTSATAIGQKKAGS